MRFSPWIKNDKGTDPHAYCQQENWKSYHTDVTGKCNPNAENEFCDCHDESLSICKN